jgi:hypothetical protein
LIDSTDRFAYVNDPSEDVVTKVMAMKNYIRGGHEILLPSAEAACRSFVAHFLEYGGEKLREAAVLVAAEQLAASFGLVCVPSLPDHVQTKIKK